MMTVDMDVCHHYNCNTENKAPKLEVLVTLWAPG